MIPPWNKGTIKPLIIYDRFADFYGEYGFQIIWINWELIVDFSEVLYQISNYLQEF